MHLLTLLFAAALPVTTPLATSEIDSRQQSEFLSHERAFILSQEQDDDKVTISWHIEPGYYLYDHAFDIKQIPDAFVQRITSPKVYTDEYFGDIHIHKNEAVLTIPAEYIRSEQLTLTYRGCAEAGLCYPPITVELPVEATEQPDTSTMAQLKKWAGMIMHSFNDTNDSPQEEGPK